MSDKIRKVSFWRIFFPSLIALLVASIISIIFFFSTLAGFMNKYMAGTSDASSDNLPQKTFLKMTFPQPVGDLSYQRFNTSNFMLEQQNGLGEILYGLDKAKDDDNVAGIYIDASNISIGYANLFELRNALKDFMKTGKKVVIYGNGEAISTKMLYLTTVTPDSYLFPKSNVEFLGMSSQLMFYKNLLDKLDIQVQVIRGEGNDFKSAVEPYFRTNMSDSSRMQTQRYIDGIWNEILAGIAESRKMKVSTLNDLASNAKILTGEDAKSHGLVAGVKYQDEVLDIVKKYQGLDANKEANFYDFNKYARNKYRNEYKKKTTDKSIALIFAEGEITTDGDGISSAKVGKYLREARNDNNIKTIIFRVNSPGGSALASEEIWREVKLAAEKKKVYVSMGNVAASGGYYISSAATRIFADPNTITGSIGVFGVIPNFGNAMNKYLGITFDGVKTNKFANVSLMRALTPEELGIVQNSVNDIYYQFLSRVAKGRNMDVSRVKEIAKGHVWLGEDAIKIGLVDEMGGLVHTIDYVKKQVGDLPLAIWPKIPDNDWRDFLDVLKDSNTSTGDASMGISKEVVNYYRELQGLENHFGIQMRAPYNLSGY